ncbi:hypothetical protein [Ruania halotolerans]|uniref:hypothetical protein n=1 Tax=Ruania halotolerans TaxID=2897773 RepID=UPI001E2D672E|nr:hypothetical protein [Ruania halotolerans]UFU07157.1 hypothetical protein LQF10_03325 [Ruania halotolerans]
MNTDPRDEAMDRLRAADPAAGSTPDLHALRAAVDARRGDVGHGDAEHSGGEGGEAQHSATSDQQISDELARRRKRSRTPWLAAAAVGALLFTGGGYALGVNGVATGSDNAAASDEAVEDMAAEASEADGAAEPGMLAPGAAQSEASDEALSYPSGQRTVFTASGLSTQSSAAHAFGLDATGVATAERVAQIAQALGMSGETTESDGMWSLGSYDSGGPVLRVYPDGTVDYSNPALDPWRCEELAEGTEPAEEDGSGTSSSAGCADPTGSAPPEEDAENLLREALTALGVDPDDYAVAADRGTEGPLAYVTAALLVDGEATGVTIGGGVSADGVANLWGSLAEPYDLGSYDVISPQAAVERLMDPRFGGASSDVMPMETGDEDLAAESGTADIPAEVDPDSPVEGPAGPTAPPALVDPGAAIPWPVRQVSITGAELGLQTLYTGSGRILLVPTYTLTGADAEGESGTWTVIAISEEHLDQG